MKTVICIGGAPVSGKSTIARELSRVTGLPWISTDQIRRIVKSVVLENDFPNLFYQEHISASEYYAQHTVADVVYAELQQAFELWTAIRAFVEKDHVWNEGVIIEGIGIIPELFAEHWLDKTNYHGYFLYQNDETILHQRITDRGLWGKAGSYPESIIPLEVQWVQQYNTVIIDSCARYGLPVFDMNTCTVDSLIETIRKDSNI